MTDHKIVAPKLNLNQSCLEFEKNDILNTNQTLVNLQKQIELEWLKKKSEKDKYDREVEAKRLFDLANLELDKKVSNEKLEKEKNEKLELDRLEIIRLENERIDKIRKENERLEKIKLQREKESFLDKDSLEKKNKIKEHDPIRPISIPVITSDSKNQSPYILSPSANMNSCKIEPIEIIAQPVNEMPINEIEKNSLNFNANKINELEAKIEKLIDLQNEKVFYFNSNIFTFI